MSPKSNNDWDKESQEDASHVERSQERDRELNLSSSAPSLTGSVHLPLQPPYRTR